MQAIINQASAIVTASAAVAVAVEARRIRQTVDRHERTLYGTEYRNGIVYKVKRLWRQRAGGDDA